MYSKTGKMRQRLNYTYAPIRKTKISMRMASPDLTCISLLALLASFACASDPALHDFCVAEPDATAAVFVNGKLCKNPNAVTSDDFYIAAGLNTPGNTSMGTGTNIVDVDRFPGLRTVGVTILRSDFAPNGFVQLHTHPRANEVIFVLEGSIYVGFATSNPLDNTGRNVLFSKILNPGDVFIFPLGLVHFLCNVGRTNAVTFVSFDSQNPGAVYIPNAVFGSTPPIPDDVLSKAFRLEKQVVDFLTSQKWSN